ncbi:hypothetical protein BC332_33515 [Capsicum chinense]|nr:hypothetical protein BC332_33515 [Capsicum chinense]
MPISNHNVNSATTMQKTGELEAPLVVPEANYVFDPVETIQSDWIENTSRKGKKFMSASPTLNVLSMNRWWETSGAQGFPFLHDIILCKNYFLGQYPDKDKALLTLNIPFSFPIHHSTSSTVCSPLNESTRADASTDWREFTSPEGRKYYYNKVTRTSKWKMPDEVKLACEKDTISHASDFGSISVVKTSSPGADGSLVSAHGAKSSPIAVSPTANLPAIVASESSSLSGKVSSPMIETVEMKNSSEPASPAVANSVKIGIAVTLGNSVAPLVFETTTAQDAVVYGDGFSSENRENVKKDAAITEIGGATPSDQKTVELGPLVYESKAAKSAFKTLSESANIGSNCTWDQAMRAVINDRRYGALKSLGERNKEIFIFERDERFKAVERAKDREDLFEDYVEELEKNVKLLLLNVLEYIHDLESEEEEQRKLQTEELRKAERKNRDVFRKLMEEHVAAGILNAKTNWRDYCINIKDFAAYLVVSSNTSGSTAKDLFTDVMDELEKQWLLAVVLVVIDELVGSRDRPVAVGGGGVGSRGVHGSIWVGGCPKKAFECKGSSLETVFAEMGIGTRLSDLEYLT